MTALLERERSDNAEAMDNTIRNHNVAMEKLRSDNAEAMEKQFGKYNLTSEEYEDKITKMRKEHQDEVEAL